MTSSPNETSPDQAVEAVAVTQADIATAAAFIDSLKGRVLMSDREQVKVWLADVLATHRLSAIPTPPPADHTDLIARLRKGCSFDDAQDLMCEAADALEAHASPREVELGKADRNNALLLASICQKVRHSSASVAERDEALRDAAEMLRVIARTALELG